MEGEDTMAKAKERKSEQDTQSQKQFILSVRLAAWCALLNPPVQTVHKNREQKALFLTDMTKYVHTELTYISQQITKFYLKMFPGAGKMNTQTSHFTV